MPETARRIVLARRPHGAPVPDDFRLEEGPVPEPGAGRGAGAHASGSRSTPTCAAG